MDMYPDNRYRLIEQVIVNVLSVGYSFYRCKDFNADYL